MEEKVINTDLCVICSTMLDENCSRLTIALEFTQKPIYILIEEFTETCLTEEIVNEAGICIDCLYKFNEYDEYHKLAKTVQDEISNLFVTTINQVKNNEEVIYAKEEHEEVDNEIIFNEIDDIQNDNVEEEFVLAIAEEESVLIERNKLPKKIQNAVRYETLPVLKTRTSENGFSMIQLSNFMLFQCDICDRTFKEKSKLKAHRQIHTSERNIVCPVCYKTFKTAGCLRSHKRIHNPIISECDHCGKTYTQKNELLKHIKFIHLNRRDFKCNRCKAAFGSNAHLKAHYLTHEEFRSISCEICGYAFHTKAKLQRHMQSHSGKRNFSCSICGKRFLYSYNVSAHIRHVHWKEKRKPEMKNKCRICSERFQVKASLIEHLQNVHNAVDITDEAIIFEEIDATEYEEASFEA